VSPPGQDPRVRWIESHCTMEPPPPNRRPPPDANFVCGLAAGQQVSPPTPAPAPPTPAPPTPAPPTPARA
jgi:hypothetical protein